MGDWNENQLFTSWLFVSSIFVFVRRNSYKDTLDTGFMSYNEHVWLLVFFSLQAYSVKIGPDLHLTGPKYFIVF